MWEGMHKTFLFLIPAPVMQQRMSITRETDNAGQAMGPAPAWAGAEPGRCEGDSRAVGHQLHPRDVGAGGRSRLSPPQL